MIIKHLVLSGGAFNLIDLIGALYEADEKKIFIRENIISVYGTSAGAIVLLVWLLKINKEDIFSYVINKPWNKTFKIGPKIISNLFNKKGVIDINFMKEMLESLIKSNSLSMDITLKEFFDFSKIEFNIVATDAETLDMICFNYKSHPDLSLIEAVYMSASIPVIMQPIYYQNKCIIDGFLSYNYPLIPCLTTGCDKNEILGIRIKREFNNTITPDTNILGYIYILMKQIVKKINASNSKEIKHEIMINIAKDIDIENILTSKKVRENMLNNGVNSCNLYLENSFKEQN